MAAMCRLQAAAVIPFVRHRRTSLSPAGWITKGFQRCGKHRGAHVRNSICKEFSTRNAQATTKWRRVVRAYHSQVLLKAPHLFVSNRLERRRLLALEVLWPWACHAQPPHVERHGLSLRLQDCKHVLQTLVLYRSNSRTRAAMPMLDDAITYTLTGCQINA